MISKILRFFIGIFAAVSAASGAFGVASDIADTAAVYLHS